MPFDQDEIEKQAREHAWAWFALHAGQRMQNLNFFLVATSFLIAGYGALHEKHPGAAVGVAAIGAWIALWFNRIDLRTRQLVRAAEGALETAEARLANRTNVESINMLAAVKQPSSGASSYRLAIAMIQWAIALAFLVGALYAARQAFCAA
jgi:hypothetical protein